MDNEKLVGGSSYWTSGFRLNTSRLGNIKLSHGKMERIDKHFQTYIPMRGKTSRKYNYTIKKYMYVGHISKQLLKLNVITL